MKMIHIFMVSMVGLGYAVLIDAGEGPDEPAAQITSPRSRNLFSFLRRSSSHSSSSIKSNNDPQVDKIVGSVDSIISIQSLASSPSIAGMTSQQSNRRSLRTMFRHASTSAAHDKDGDIIGHKVEEKEESLEEALAEARRNLDAEVDKAESIVIPGVIQAASNIFTQEGYASKEIAQNNNDPVADVRNALIHLRSVLQTYIARTSKVEDEYEHTIELNFSRVGDFNPKGLYPYLGLTAMEGINKSSEDIKAIINRKKEKATVEDTKWMLRQIEYVFDNSESKRLYDAYLGGQDSLKAMKLEAKEQEHYWYLSQIVGNSCAEIDRAVHEYNEIQKKILKEEQMQASSSSSLAGHALALELDEKHE